MGIGFLGFWIVNVGIFVNFFSPVEDKFLGILCLIIIILMSVYSLINARLITVKNIRIFSNKIKNEITLLFISDVHLGTNSEKYLKKIISIASKIKFDSLLIGGDLIDSSSFNISNLDKLKDIKKPILFVSGNHEYYVDNHIQKLQCLKKYKIFFLDNLAYQFKNLNIIGVSDNQKTEAQKIITNKLIKKKIFNLVLVHKPLLWDLTFENIDLMLSGHTHNGQIFPFNFFVKLQFKKIYGLYKQKNSNLYVSSGIGCWGPKMRLGSKNEIVKILISKK